MSDWHPCVVKLESISALPNSDFLEITTVMGEYPVILRKGDYKKGQLVAFIPYDSVVPDTELFHFLAPNPKKDKAGNITAPSPAVGSVPEKYRTIKAKKIRSTYSEGLIVPAPEGFIEGDSVVEHFGLTKRVYEEELPELPSKGSNENEKAPKTFALFKYDLEGMAKYGSAFEEGEQVIISEKIEGENCAIVYLEGKLWVRSRNYFKRNGYSDNRKPRSFYARMHLAIDRAFDYLFSAFKKPVALSHWWEVPIRLDLETKLKQLPGLAFWGELYGNVKHFQYDCPVVDGKIQREFRVFDIFDVNERRFLEWDQVEKLSELVGLKTVPVLYRGPWKTDHSLHELAEGTSTIGECVREGFVMRSVPEGWHEKLGRKIIKLKGRGYKLFKD